MSTGGHAVSALWPHWGLEVAFLPSPVGIATARVWQAAYDAVSAAASGGDVVMDGVDKALGELAETTRIHWPGSLDVVE